MGEQLKNLYWAVGSIGYVMLIITCGRILWITRFM